MNAQETWLSWYYKWYNSKHRGLTKKTIQSRRIEMYRYRREAALERKLEAAQRRIEYLEADRRLAQQQAADREELESWPNPFLLSGDELDRAERQLRSR